MSSFVWMGAGVRVRGCLRCFGVVAGTTTLDGFQGVVFVGGFSYADVLDSAKGWAATIKFNPKVGRLGLLA